MYNFPSIYINIKSEDITAKNIAEIGHCGTQGECRDNTDLLF